MNPRERIEEREYDVLSPRAFHVKEAKRAHAEAKDPLRTDFARDRDRILHSNSALSLNEDLVEAIALGHDLGHTPFGHVGEQALKEIYGHFEHNEQSVRIAERLERDGAGLNLTLPVLDGMLNHCGPLKAHTLEGSPHRDDALLHDHCDGD